MNQWSLILWWIRSMARHTLPQSWPCRHVGPTESRILEYDRVPLWVYHTALEWKKTPSIPWSCGMARKAFWSLRFLTATEESQITGPRKICQLGLRGYIYNYSCLVIFFIKNLVWGEYDKAVCCLAEFQKGCVCAAKQFTFMGLNSLFLWHCTRSGHRILSAFLTLGIR